MYVGLFEDKRWEDISECMHSMGASRRFPPWACERKWKERIRRQEEEAERVAKENSEKERAENEKTEADKVKIGAEGGVTANDKTDVETLVQAPKTKKRKPRVIKEDKESVETERPQRKTRGKSRSKGKALAVVEEGGEI